MSAADIRRNFESPFDRLRKALPHEAWAIPSNDVERSCGRVGRDWKARCKCLEQYQPKGIGKARETEDVRGRIKRSERLVVGVAGIFCVGLFRLEFFELGPGADHVFGAG